MKRTRKQEDIIYFAETDYILPETQEPIKLLEHQKRILRDCFTRNKDGKFPYQNIIYSCVKKSGKTEIGGLVGLWFAGSESPYNEVYYIANDLEQSQSRGYKRVCQVIDTNRRLGHRLGRLKPKRSVIEFPDGTEIQALSSDYAGEAGANPGLTIWDELWAYLSEASRRMYDELTPVPTRLNSLRFIVTYAGFEGESELLWELYQLGLAGERLYDDLPVWVNKEASLYMYWDNEPRMPWQTPEYYAQQRKTLRPNAYRRLHRNEWVSAVTSYIPIEAWDACVIPDMVPAIPPLSEPLFVGVDIGIKRDTTAIVSLYWDGERKKLKLANHHIWHPTRAEPLDFETTIEDYILDLNNHFRIGCVYYDPSQFVRSAQLLQGSGIPLVEYTQVPSNLTSMTQILFELIRGNNLEMYPSSELRKQNMDAVIVEGARGMHIAKEKTTQKIDGIVALAMACQAAWDEAGITPLPESQPDATSKWSFEPPSASIVETEDTDNIISRSRWRI